MSDRELLELAAKAAGIKCRWFKVKKFVERETRAGKARYCTGTKNVFGTHHTKPWNPLTEDGDALNLAVKFTMMIDYITKPEKAYKLGHVVAVSSAGSFYELGFTTKATRRAIVRAAAEIGKVMQ